MKRIIPLLLFIAFFFLATTISVFAQATTPVPSPTTTESPADSSPPLDDTADDNAFVTDPPQIPTVKNPDNYISDFTPSVKVSFPGLTYNDSEIYVCLRKDYCSKNFLLQNLAPGKAFQYLRNGISKDLMWEALFKETGKLSNHSLTVCGAGDIQLKTKCDPSKDYFAGGALYLITLYVKQGDQYVAVFLNGFYINHGIPDIELTPKEHLVSGTKFTLKVSEKKIRPGGKNRNNYEVVVVGPGVGGDGTKNACDWIDNTHNPRVFQFPKPDDKTDQNNHYTNPDPQALVDSGYIAQGKYTFQVNEQHNEGGDDCSGGFRYASITCTVGPDTKNNTNKCRPPIYDPRKEDGKELLELLNLTNPGNKGVPLPCKIEGESKINPLDCQSIDTAIGPISLDPIGFITKVFSIVLTLAGVGAFLLIIYSGYRLLLSRGNKEIIQGARETLTAAIVGLLFIIFSLVILSVIAVDILKIPGFG